MKKWLLNIYYSFAFQLLILHIRSNHLLIGMWLIIVMFISGQLAQKLGAEYLFLDPEYGGDVNFWSFLFMGVAFGGYFMTWNLTTYLLSAQYFPFLASLSRPFTKFCINNIILPLTFLIFYLSFIIYFQRNFEGLSFLQIGQNCFGFFVGLVIMIGFYALYFKYTNRDISFYDSPTEVVLSTNPPKSIAPGRRDIDLEYIKLDTNRWKVKTYLTESMQPRIVRSVAHYDSTLLLSIFKQNHLNALIMQLLSMILLVVLGYLIDHPAFRIPAGASIFILISILTAIIGALTYWFNEWRVTIIILLLIGINYFTSFELFNHKNKAYGMNYSTTPAKYSLESIQQIIQDSTLTRDKANTINILNNWKKNIPNSSDKKPNMVFLCVSGGGLKSARFTMNVVRNADQLLNGKLTDHTVLITGSSGGLIGMAYWRELYLRSKTDSSIDLYDLKYIDNISKDLLNSIAFTLVTNDLFLPWAKFEAGGYTYRKDRGYIFEQQLNENTDYILDKPIGDYQEAEKAGIIPMMYITPSIINDARRLTISAQGVSFMMIAPMGIEREKSVEIDAVDFGQIFQKQDAMNLRLTTALRMNSSYPYVLPSVYLPSEPGIEVLDAGFLDNYGILSATRFIQVFKEWIFEHVNKVIIVQIASSDKAEAIKPSDDKGIIESMFDPIGIPGQLLVLQEFEHDNSLGFIYDILGPERFEVIRFLYLPTQESRREASISFHITNQEKIDVLNAINGPENQESLNRLIKEMSE